jgi:hypothetical protein
VLLASEQKCPSDQERGADCSYRLARKPTSAELRIRNYRVPDQGPDEGRGKEVYSVTYQERQTPRRGVAGWSRTRWLVLAAVVIAIVVVVLLVLLHGGGSGGGAGGGGGGGGGSWG